MEIHRQMLSSPSTLDNNKSGFTLVELSIVLVIIGLIVAGVLVGRDLVRSSEVRAQISQIEKLNTAIQTFRIKYNGLPGDLKYTDASAFGLYNVTYGPYIGLFARGDSNGIIQSRVQGFFTDEHLMFFRHLSDANLIEGGIGSKLNTAAETTTDVVSDYIPLAKIGSNASIQILSASTIKTHYFVLSSTTIVAGGCCNFTSLNTLTAQESYQIDSKIDDGLPASGVVFAINSLAGLTLYSTLTTVSAVAGCVTSSAYSLNIGTTRDCSLRFKF